AQPAGAAVDDEDQVARRQAEPVRVVRLEDGADPGQLHEVVAPADRAQPLGVTGGDVALHHVPGGVVVVRCAVEVGEAGGEFLRVGALQLDGEHGDAAADVGAHQEGVERGRRHGGADRGGLAGVQVRHGGDVLHAVE